MLASYEILGEKKFTQNILYVVTATLDTYSNITELILAKHKKASKKPLIWF
jgi:hypothetical protein